LFFSSATALRAGAELDAPPLPAVCRKITAAGPDFAFVPSG
jgi:hypothetical protein